MKMGRGGYRCGDGEMRAACPHLPHIIFRDPRRRFRVENDRCLFLVRCGAAFWLKCRSSGKGVEMERERGEEGSVHRPSPTSTERGQTRCKDETVLIYIQLSETQISRLFGLDMSVQPSSQADTAATSGPESERLDFRLRRRVCLFPMHIANFPKRF